MRTTRGIHPSGSGGAYGRRSEVANGRGFALHHRIMVSLMVKEINEVWWWLRKWFREFMVIVGVVVALTRCRFVEGRDTRRLEAVQNGGTPTVQRW